MGRGLERRVCRLHREEKSHEMIYDLCLLTMPWMFVSVLTTLSKWSGYIPVIFNIIQPYVFRMSLICLLCIYQSRKIAVVMVIETPGELSTMMQRCLWFRASIYIARPVRMFWNKFEHRSLASSL